MSPRLPARQLRLAFCLVKYFPFGGMQRNFLRIAQACLEHGHEVHVYALEWQGERPSRLKLTLLRIKTWLKHQRGSAFAQAAAEEIAKHDYDAVIGFNRMPGLDVYYAADPCFVARAQKQRGKLYRLSARYRDFAALEKAVFAPESGTEILVLSEVEKANFIRHYGTPAERFHLLPPEIATDRFASSDAPLIRAGLRAEFGIAPSEKLLVLIGSGFKTKGLDRALLALASLPAELRSRTRLIAIGQDNPRPFLRLARRLKLSRQVSILPGRDDIPRFLQGADLLIHPAYAENTGTILIEAMAAGLPVLTTDACGYSPHVKRAGAGYVLASPFDQSELDSRLAEMLMSDQHRHWHDEGIRYAASLRNFSRTTIAMEVIETRAIKNAERRREVVFARAD